MTNTAIANQLSDLRNAIKKLHDAPAMDYVSHAIDQNHRRNVKATETWLQMAITRVNEIAAARAGARA